MRTFPREVLVEVETPYGDLFVHPDEAVVGRLLPATGMPQLAPEEEALLGRVVRPESHCVDVGANYGLWALNLFMRLSPHDGSLTLVEPNPRCVEALTETFAYDTWVTIIEAALGHPAIVRLGRLIAENGTGGGQVRPELGGDIPITGLDDLVFAETSSGRCDFLKIDAEGADLDILLGAPRTMREARPVIVFERNDAAMHALGHDPAWLWEELTRVLGARGYRLPRALTADNWLLEPR